MTTNEAASELTLLGTPGEIATEAASEAASEVTLPVTPAEVATEATSEAASEVTLPVTPGEVATEAASEVKLPATTSEAGGSMCYGSVTVRLLPQSPDDNAYFAPTDQARELVRKMPEDVRRTLLAPIEEGIIDKNSVLYFFDDLEKRKVAISAEDFVLLADATRRSQSFFDTVRDIIDTEVNVVPQSLINALSEISGDAEVYTSVTEEVAYEQTVPEYSSIDEIVEYKQTIPVPPVPLTRPPVNSSSNSEQSGGMTRRVFYSLLKHRRIVAGVLILFGLLLVSGAAVLVFVLR